MTKEELSRLELIAIAQESSTAPCNTDNTWIDPLLQKRLTELKHSMPYLWDSVLAEGETEDDILVKRMATQLAELIPVAEAAVFRLSFPSKFRTLDDAISAVLRRAIKTGLVHEGMRKEEHEAILHKLGNRDGNTPFTSADAAQLYHIHY